MAGTDDNCAAGNESAGPKKDAVAAAGHDQDNTQAGAGPGGAATPAVGALVVTADTLTQGDAATVAEGDSAAAPKVTDGGTLNASVSGPTLELTCVDNHTKAAPAVGAVQYAADPAPFGKQLVSTASRNTQQLNQLHQLAVDNSKRDNSLEGMPSLEDISTEQRQSGSDDNEDAIRAC